MRVRVRIRLLRHARRGHHRRRRLRRMVSYVQHTHRCVWRVSMTMDIRRVWWRMDDGSHCYWRLDPLFIVVGIVLRRVGRLFLASSIFAINGLLGRNFVRGKESAARTTGTPHSVLVTRLMKIWLDRHRLE
jgi:hypothetical protein